MKLVFEGTYSNLLPVDSFSFSVDMFLNLYPEWWMCVIFCSDLKVIMENTFSTFFYEPSWWHTQPQNLYKTLTEDEKADVDLG